MSTAFDFDDGVGGAGGEHAVDPFADYQQPSAGVGFADDEDEQRPPPLASAPSPSPPTTGDVRHQQTSPAAVSSPSQPTKGSGGQVDDENSPLRVWQREQQERLAERQKKSQEEHDKIRAAARAEIDKFYQERRLQCEKTAQQNRTAQAELQRDESGANAKGWARCVQLIDLNAGRTEGKDVSRMRKILLEAKHGALPLRAN